MKNGFVLAIESASSVCSIAISQVDNVLLEYSISIPNSHDEFLAEFVNRGMKDLGLAPQDILALAVSSGPGSFTGLRIGSAFAKGFCFDGKIKLVPVPTLFALAYNSREVAKCLSKRIVSVMHSHKNLFFYQFFDLNLQPMNEVSFLSQNEIEEICSETDFIVGIGADSFNVGTKINTFNTISASLIAKAGWKLLDEGKFVSPEDFVPSYYLEFQPKAKSK